MRSRWMVGLLTWACVGSLGCRKTDDASSSGGDGGAKRRGVIALSVLTLTNPFFKTIGKSMKAEAAKHGYDVMVVSGEFDPARQQNQVKDFIVKKVSAIVLCPCNSKSIGPVIIEANRAGIPVFTADIACLDPEAKVVSHIATDNKQGGRLAAEAIIEALGGKGKVAILDYPVVESVILRTEGFDEVLAERNAEPDVDIEVVDRLPGDGAREPSLKATQDLLQAHPDLDGIFAVNDPSALGAWAALQSAGRADEVVIVGFDGQREGKQAIKEGKIYADPVQFPEKIGTQTVRAIVDYFEGEPVEPRILIPTSLYRRADAEKDPELN